LGNLEAIRAPELMLWMADGLDGELPVIGGVGCELPKLPSDTGGKGGGLLLDGCDGTGGSSTIGASSLLSLLAVASG
jgi:hypothetical protein